MCSTYKLTVKIKGNFGIYGGVGVDGEELQKVDKVYSYTLAESHQIRALPRRLFNSWVIEPSGTVVRNPFLIVSTPYAPNYIDVEVAADVTVTAWFGETPPPPPPPDKCTSTHNPGVVKCEHDSHGDEVRHRAVVEW